MNARIVPTQSELIQKISDVMDKELHDNFIKNMVQGFELANNMLLEYIDSGKTLEEIREFVHKNTVDGRKSIMKVCKVESEEK